MATLLAVLPTLPAWASAPAPEHPQDAAGAPEPEGRKIVVHDATKIYYGDAATAQVPAVIVQQRVMEKIAEYQEIKRRGLTDKDAEYYLLLQKAVTKFKCAVKKAAKAEKKDLVAEVGAIEIPGETIPDITDRVIAEVGA